MGDNPQAEMTREMKIITIARVCHEANRTWCQEHGDTSHSPWFGAEPALRAGTIRGVECSLTGKTPEEMHRAWAEDKLLGGWRYGDKKDAKEKTHPNLCPYDRLPEYERVKDRLFLGIVHALAPALGLMEASITGWRPFNGDEIAGAESTFFDEGTR